VATGRILDFLIIGALVLVIAMLIIGRLPFYQQTGESIVQKSIAILPFENLSEEKANAYFAEGVQNEILTRLATVRDLKVISRTSTAKYQSKPDNLKTVAQELGVSTILEGAVQNAGDRRDQVAHSYRRPRRWSLWWARRCCNYRSYGFISTSWKDVLPMLSKLSTRK
jgi:hypothetical protein